MLENSHDSIPVAFDFELMFYVRNLAHSKIILARYFYWLKKLKILFFFARSFDSKVLWGGGVDRDQPTWESIIMQQWLHLNFKEWSIVFDKIYFISQYK